MSNMSMKPLAEVARLLGGIPRSSVYEVSGRDPSLLPIVKIGGRAFVREASVQRYLGLALLHEQTIRAQSLGLLGTFADVQAAGQDNARRSST